MWGGTVQAFSRILKRFGHNDRGSIAIIFGVSLLVLSFAVAMAYDSSRLSNVTTRVQSSLDAAALAAAKLLDQEGSTDGEVVAMARGFFNVHRPQIVMNGLSLGDAAATINRSDATVRVSVAGTLTSLFGRLSGQSPTLNFTRVSQTTYKTKKIELSLVLDVTGSMSSGGKINSLKTAAKDLVDTLFASNPNKGAIRLSLVPYSASVNVGGYKTAVSGTAGDDCVVERDGAYTITDDATSSGGYLGTSDTTLNSRYTCPTAAVEPLTDLWDSTLRAAFKTRIDALSPAGATAGHIGLAWGWYFLSPKWASLWPSAQRPKPPSPDVVKAIIFMTDGEFNTSYLPSGTNSLDVATPGSSGDQTLAMCAEMKKPGSDIAVYTIGFQAPIAAETMLRSCSGDANFFDAASAGDLIAAFREIVTRLNNLRISS